MCVAGVGASANGQFVHSISLTGNKVMAGEMKRRTKGSFDEFEEGLGDKENVFKAHIDETYNNYSLKLLDIEETFRDYIKHMEQITIECRQMCISHSFAESLTINTQQIEVKLAAVLNRMKLECGDKDLNASIFTDFVDYQTKIKKVAFFSLIAPSTSQLSICPIENL